MPRISLAYSVTPKTVVRGGYGIFYAPIGVVSTSVNQTGFSQVTTMVPSVDNVHYVATLTNPFPNGFIPVSGASSGLSTALGNTVSFFNPSLKSPYMERWQAAVQRVLPGSSVLEVSYVGDHAVHQLVTKNFDALPDQYLSTTGSNHHQPANGRGCQPFLSIAAGDRPVGDHRPPVSIADTLPRVHPSERIHQPGLLLL